METIILPIDLKELDRKMAGLSDIEAPVIKGLSYYETYRNYKIICESKNGCYFIHTESSLFGLRLYGFEGLEAVIEPIESKDSVLLNIKIRFRLSAILHFIYFAVVILSTVIYSIISGNHVLLMFAFIPIYFAFVIPKNNSIFMSFIKNILTQ